MPRDLGVLNIPGGHQPWGGWQGTPGHAEDPLPLLPRSCWPMEGGPQRVRSVLKLSPGAELNQAGGGRVQGWSGARGLCHGCLLPCSLLHR